MNIMNIMEIMLINEGGIGVNNLDNMNQKIDWLQGNGFQYKHCPVRKVGTWNYKGYSWTLQEINLVSLEALQQYKKFYDNKITEKELDNFLEDYKVS